MDVDSGRYTAQISGIYQFSANIHIDGSDVRRKDHLRPRDCVRVHICIDSQCSRHAPLETASGLESNSRVFTLHLQGLLQLQIGQHTSVSVENGAGAAIVVQKDSDFMGVLVGV